MKNQWWAGLAASVVLLSACGSGGGGGNAAAGRTFTYGAPVTASLQETQLLDGQVATATAMQGQPDAMGGTAIADFQSISGTLLGGTLGTARLAALRQAAPSASDEALRLAASASAAPVVSGFDDPGCVSQTLTSVTLSHCTMTLVDVDSTVATTIDGYVKVPAADTLAYDLTARVTLTSADFSMTATSHQAGTLEVTATAMKAAMRTELDATMRAGVQSVAFGVDEALDVDVTYEQGPPPCITGGTLEARRVWTRRPSGVDPAQVRDAAARVTWTGCGTGTVEFSQ